ncbi:MAG: ATP-grasp domain-containing protein [Spirosomataceae bacterium]
MKRNILITSAGKRVSLVKAFINELNAFFPEARVFTADMNPEWSPACRVSNGYFQLPPVSDSIYCDALLSLCLQESIGLVIPTIDNELLCLSQAKEYFKAQGIQIAVSDHSLVQKCRDKRITNSLFKELGVDLPQPIDPFQPTFPVFIKPYDGSLSRDIQVIFTADYWNPDLANNSKLLFMEYLGPNEYQEYTVDAYYDQVGRLKCMVPRKRIEIRAGEISKGSTEKSTLYESLKTKISYIKGAVSCLTIQFFQHKETDQILGIEINPRFGGGYPLSYQAGANFPKMLIEEYFLGINPSFFEGWKHGTVMLRYDQEIILQENDFSPKPPIGT